MKRLKHVLAVLLISLAASVARAQSPFGNAITFDGTNEYVNIPNFGNIIPTNEITVEFWANTSLAADQSAFILDPDDSGNRLNAHLNYVNGTSPPQGVTYWDFGKIVGGGRISSINAPVNSVGNWVHYAFVASRSGNFMSIYTNGVLMATQAGMTPFVRGAYDLHIGGTSNYFCYHGSIDEFRVWNVARSQAQIQANLGVPLTGAETNLLVYYRFDEGSGAVAMNSATATGAAYNGTLITSPTWAPSTVGSVPILNSVVTSASDSGGGTLRAAVKNALPGTTITFADGLNGSTIALASGALTLNQNLTIDASGLPGGLAIDGLGADRIFVVNAGTSNCLVGLTLTNGNSGSAAGGAIVNAGVLELNQCTVISNTTTSPGGGVFNAGALFVNACTFAGNSSVSLGEEGGAIYSSGALTVNQSTFTRNSANGGGAIFADAGSTTAVYQSTIVSNTAFCCGGGITFYTSSNNILVNSIVAGNSKGDLFGFAPFANNDFIGGNPGVGPLANNGGPTPTMALLPGSPAINGGGPVNEIQQVTVTGPAGSTFTLTFDGATTPPLSVGATAAPVSSALNALAPIGAAGGSVSVTVTGNVYTVTFEGGLSGVNSPQMSANAPPGVTATVSTLLDGMPMPAFDQRGTGFPRFYGGAVDIGAYELSPDITAVGVIVNGTEGAATGLVTVAGFSNRLGGSTPADYNAAITWGDGTPATAGTVSIDSTGNFEVLGNHTYVEEGDYTVSVTITNTTAATPAVTAISTADIADAPLAMEGGFTVDGTAGVAVPLQIVATFTDTAGAENLTNYVAAIDWGDGTLPTPGQIIETSTGEFEVWAGGHTYATGHNYAITVMVIHENYVAGPVTSPANISRVNATITVTAAANPSIYGQPVLYTATLTPPPGYPFPATGLVQFIVDGTYLGQPVPIIPDNQAIMPGSALPAGQHSIAVSYAGDPNYAGGLGIGTQTVIQGNTMTTVASSANPSSLGQPVTFTAGVTGLAPAIGTPTGSVQFVIDGVNIGGPVVLDTMGRAELTTSSISAAGSPHAVTAQYSGDPNFVAGLGTLAGGQVVTSTFSTPLVLTAPAKGTNGSFGFAFTNVSGGSFTVFASTNPALPLSVWSNLGPAVESPSGSGHFQFTDTQAPGTVRRFYVVRTP